MNPDKIPIPAPAPGESITEVLLAAWLVADGGAIAKDGEIAEIESDKATLVVYAPESGILRHQVAEGETVAVGSTIAFLEPGKVGISVSEKAEKPHQETSEKVKEPFRMTPLARSYAEAEKIAPEVIRNLNKDLVRIGDLRNRASSVAHKNSDARPLRRVKMSPLRQKLAERLVSVKNETAMLTTFNEVDMSRVVAYRRDHRQENEAAYGFNIGFISFFAQAAALAFAEFPQINASIDGEDIVYYDYSDICIAVSTPKGLMAPAIRDVQLLDLPAIEGRIRDFSVRAAENRITMDELRGGTFTISNGGTYGSMMSTPIINPPQSAILGLHRIADRPVAVGGKVEIRPMMYIALSYDHRLIDGRESVGFVMKVKEWVEQLPGL